MRGDRQVPHVVEGVKNEVGQRAVVLDALVVDVDVRLTEIHLREILVDEALEVARRPLVVGVRGRRRQRLDRRREGVVHVQPEAVYRRPAAEVQGRRVAG